jgi:hypothetical protein
VLLAGGAFTAIEVRWTRTFDAPYPDIHATRDPVVIARGEYLAYGPAACAYCHVPKSEWTRLDAGDALPLSGLHLFRLPMGDLYSANLTPDGATGVGRRTDGELARILRHGVRADGRAAFPFHGVPESQRRGPTPTTSPIGQWTEEAFLVRFRQGEVVNGSRLFITSVPGTRARPRTAAIRRTPRRACARRDPRSEARIRGRDP